MINCKILLNYLEKIICSLVSSNKPLLIIPWYWHHFTVTFSQTTYLFEVKVNLLANTLTPDVAKYHLSRITLPATFVVGPLVLPREKYPYNTIQVRRCMPTNAQKVKSAVIPLTGGTVFRGLTRKCHTIIINIL